LRSNSRTAADASKRSRTLSKRRYPFARAFGFLAHSCTLRQYASPAREQIRRTGWLELSQYAMSFGAGRYVNALSVSRSHFPVVACSGRRGGRPHVSGGWVPQFDLPVDPGVRAHRRMPDVPHLVDEPCDEMHAAFADDCLDGRLFRRSEKVARTEDASTATTARSWAGSGQGTAVVEESAHAPPSTESAARSSPYFRVAATRGSEPRPPPRFAAPAEADQARPPTHRAQGGPLPSALPRQRVP
jgi:hypothetical protein